MPEPSKNQHKTDPRVGFVSLGCPKATVDSERIITQLRAEGYAIAPDYKGADMVIVNTCGFIDAAVEESLHAIGEAIDENGRVIVTGCLGAREQMIRDAHPAVLAVTGPQALDEVMQAVHDELPPRQDPFSSLIPPGGIKLTPRHYAWLKISEGCNHKCTFCIIPSMRGRLNSRPIGDVMREAEALVSAGVRELLIVSQDTSAYGQDLGYPLEFVGGRPLSTKMIDLARGLSTLDAWVRFHYVYPYPHVDELIPLMVDSNVLPYLDIPFQHASHRVLKLMKRPANAERVLERIAGWREICPALTIRSTFITGFPGETEAEFEELLEFLRVAQLDRVGCFAYSPVTGASANDLPDPLPEAVREERRRILMDVQAEISEARLAARIGGVETVLIDSAQADTAVARSRSDAPEIDGLVHVRDVAGVNSGDFVDVEIVDSDAHDLFAVPVETNTDRH